MKAPFPGGDTQPWYRQFWPWFLILLPATVVVASLYTMYLASSGADDLVVDEYYKDGLAINRQLEKKQRSEALGIRAELVFSGGLVNVRVTAPTDVARLSLLLSHPLEADRDFSVELKRVGPGLYRGVLADSVAPRWHWTLELPGPEGWRLDGSVASRDIGNAAVE
ncbi:FixH family protein [Pseudomonadota bacterium]